jgi:nitroreductase
VETRDAILSRRQVRDFSGRPVDDAALELVLAVAARAPSSRNRQRWDFVVVQDREQLARLSGVWRSAGWIAGSAATVALVVPVSTDASEREEIRFDLGQAAMLMMVMATDLGISSGQATCADQALARDVLGLPADRECAMLIALGYGPELRPIARPARRPLDDVVHRGRW